MNSYALVRIVVALSLVTYVGWPGTATAGCRTADLMAASVPFPSDLDEDSLRTNPDLPPLRLEARAIISEPECIIAVAFSNGHGGNVRAIRVDEDHTEILAEYREWLIGSTPRIRTVILGRPDSLGLVVDFAANKGNITWILRWDGQSLVNIGPVIRQNGYLLTELADPLLEDLDGDGVVEVVDTRESGSWSDSEGDGPDAVYKLSATGFEPWRSCPFWEVFSRAEGVPKTFRNEFRTAEPERRHTLVILNGEPDRKPVTSGLVTLNGITIVRPEDFSATVDRIEKSIDVLYDNQLVVELRGTPPSGMMVFVLQE